MSESEFDLPRCLAEVRAHDEAAARRLVDYLYPRLLRIVRSHLPRGAAEEDLTQEIYMKIFTRLDQFRGDMPLEHWVSRIAMNTCLDHLRKQQRKPALRMADLTEDHAELIENALADTAADHEETNRAAHELVGLALEQLDPKDAMIIRLLELEDRSVREIAQITGWNASAVKVRAFRARLKLRKILEPLRAHL